MLFILENFNNFGDNNGFTGLFGRRKWFRLLIWLGLRLNRLFITRE